MALTHSSCVPYHKIIHIRDVFRYLHSLQKNLNFIYNFVRIIGIIRMYYTQIKYDICIYRKDGFAEVSKNLAVNTNLKN